MPDTFASELLRPGLLDGVRLLLVGPQRSARGSAGAAIAAACAELGARVSICEASEPPSGEPPSSEAEEAQMDASVERVLSSGERPGVLVVDAGALFAGTGERMGSAAPSPAGRELGRAALRACLDGAWNATRAVVRSAFLAGQQGGRIVYVAPAPGVGEHAEAARAGLENLARTLSVEWARHGITVVAIAPGTATSPEELAALTAYLASSAGAYFSGCLLDLSGPA
jgi:NAD(P)-dependent dehydrogenase (short-subunit alcohol dehydrogenase family)